MSDRDARLAANLRRVRERITEAALRVGRSPETITLVAVTKYVDVPTAAALVGLGCRDLGESRPQALWRKYDAWADEVTGVGAPRWHLIGHLQRNKIRRTLPMVQWIHSVDSLGLAQEIDRVAKELHLRPQVLLEVNVSGESAKHGFRPADLLQAAEAVAALSQIRVQGLMTMAPLEADADEQRRVFEQLAEFQRQLRSATPALGNLPELSMGMSGDFEAAIAAGATLVRIGSALFEGC